MMTTIGTTMVIIKEIEAARSAKSVAEPEYVHAALEAAMHTIMEDAINATAVTEAEDASSAAVWAEMFLLLNKK